jgi:hypothetical protein
MDTDWIIIGLLVFLLWLLLSPNRRRPKRKWHKGRGVDFGSIGFPSEEYVSKGEYGEYAVASVLEKLPKEYRVFNDVYLENKGFSSQIDHVVISQYGVFVIETKNYSGNVYGSEKAEHWTQYLNGEGYEFRNPILQNRSHELAIKNTLHIAPSCIIPIVVFLGGTDLHCNTTSAVLYTVQLCEYILNHQTIAFTPDGVERLARKLSESMVIDPNRRINHVRNIRQNIARQESQVANLICPRCGGKLVERKGKSGRFLGCSNYPHCKFTTQL